MINQSRFRDLLIWRATKNCPRPPKKWRGSAFNVTVHCEAVFRQVPNYLYHLESRWRNSHVMVYNGSGNRHLISLLCTICSPYPDQFPFFYLWESLFEPIRPWSPVTVCHDSRPSHVVPCDGWVFGRWWLVAVSMPRAEGPRRGKHLSSGNKTLVLFDHTCWVTRDPYDGWV